MMQNENRQTGGGMFDLRFYQEKSVLVTGHTGFKGAWLCKALVNAGARVTGFALPPEKPSLFALTGLSEEMHSVTGDVRDRQALQTVFDKAKPEIVFHLAAQPLVRESYRQPVYTYETNVMGTVHVLECVRNGDSVRSFLNVTTDKVYLNREWAWGYRENDELNGFDPYANSKSCSELVTQAYKNSFFSDGRTAISTARAGNVIGGGDFAVDRIVPDCVRAAVAGRDISVRNPAAVRPYQHVLEAVHAYLMIAARQHADGTLAGCYNIGPDEGDCLRTDALVDLFIRCWGNGIKRVDRPDGGPHEAHFLRLDCAKMKDTFGWRPRWNIERAMEMTVAWSRCWASGGDVRACMDAQIQAFWNEER